MKSYMFSKPIVMPRGTKYGSDYWIVFSTKLNRSVNLYSLLEYYNFLSLEMNPQVEYFCEQPLKIEYLLDEKTKYSYFDFWVYYKDNHSEFQEVKYSKELTGNLPEAIRSQNQIKHQKQWCEENGSLYRVVTEQELILGEYYIENIKALQHRVARFERLDYSFFLQRFKRYMNACKKNLTLKDIILADIFQPGEELNYLACFFQEGFIEMDLENRPLDENMEVTYAGTEI